MRENIAMGGAMLFMLGVTFVKFFDFFWWLR